MAKTRLLVVEDERIIAMAIERRLRALGYDVVGLAGNGAEALSMVARFSPSLVLLDIHLGEGIDGVTVAQEIRAKWRIPVVFLTAHSDEATLQRAKITEPFGYVVKPFEDHDLRTAIEIAVYKHRMEERLRENEQWLTATLTSISDGVIATDGEGRVRFLNNVAEQLTGWTQAEAQKQPLAQVFNVVEERSRRPYPNIALQAMEQGEPVTLTTDALLLHREGIEYPIDDSAAPICDDHGTNTGAVVVFRDISERRRLEEHLRQAQKLEAISRLAGGIAHDFNNIMTIITGFSEMLLHDDLPPAEQREFVTNIFEAGQKAAGLTQQIMAFGRKQMLMPSVLNLNTIVRDMAPMIRRLLGMAIDLETRPALDLGNINADPTQISQVLLNLAANARDAMPNGGILSVSTANASLAPEDVVAQPNLGVGEYAVLTVSDTGCGMTPEVLAHIFEPFFTTKELGQGTGLGLATVYGIVKQSEGYIDVSSKPGVGTRVDIYLPLVEAPSSVDELRAVPVQGTETILVVEDDNSVRRMMGMVLRQYGYQVHEAPTGQEGYALVAQGTPVDLLLTDLMMPGWSGRETAERIGQLRPNLPILFMSGYSEDEVMQQGIQQKKVNFLKKPCTIAELTSKVRRVLDAKK